MTREPTEMETRVQHAIFEKHMELLRGFYKPSDLDALSGEKVDAEKLFGPWESQSDLARDVYLQMARAAIRAMLIPTTEMIDAALRANQWIFPLAPEMSEVLTASIDAASPPEET